MDLHYFVVVENEAFEALAKHQDVERYGFQDVLGGGEHLKLLELVDPVREGGEEVVVDFELAEVWEVANLVWQLGEPVVPDINLSQIIIFGELLC